MRILAFDASNLGPMTRLSVLALAAALCAACAPELNWREWRNDEAALVQLFPCKPVRQQRRLTVADRELLLVLQVCDAGDITWAQAHADVGDPLALVSVMDALVAAAHGNLSAERSPAAAHGVPGSTPQTLAGRYRIHGRAPDGRPIDEAVLLFAKETVVVQVTALGMRLPDEAVEAFFESVRALR